jgi:hypothetical protein
MMVGSPGDRPTLDNVWDSEFKGTFSLRDWLAHGRYWAPKLGRAQGFLPGDIFDICKQLLKQVELL